jgi:hypothetical protein
MTEQALQTIVPRDGLMKSSNGHFLQAGFTVWVLKDSYTIAINCARSIFLSIAKTR